MTEATTEKKPRKKRERAAGLGSLYLRGKVWWMAYKHPDGTRVSESCKTNRKPVAQRLLLKRVGAGANNLAVIAKAEQLTFYMAAQMLINRFIADHAIALAAEKKNVVKALKVLRRRAAAGPLAAHFGAGKRMISFTSDQVDAYIAKRLADTVVVRKAQTKTLEDGTVETVAELRKPVSPATINRELQTLKRMFSLAVKANRIATKPNIEMLKEAPPRAGFFEREQFASVMRHLPAELRPVIAFAYLTGWRIASEVLPLEWRQVDMKAGEVRLDAGTTKNGEGRVFPFTAELRAILTAQQAEHERLQKAGHIFPNVFFREVAEGRGGVKKPKAITSLNKAWNNACKAAGCPGQIPHDMRRSAVRNLVRAGVPKSIAMQLTGHKTESVFDRYDITSGDDLRSAARLLDIAAAR